MVVDTSAWVEYLRATGSPADAALTDAVRASDDIGVPDVVRLELLSGFRRPPAGREAAPDGTRPATGKGRAA